MENKVTILKAPKGFHIEKEVIQEDMNKVLRKGTVIYLVTTEDGDGIIGVYTTLKEAHNACKEFMRRWKK